MMTFKKEACELIKTAIAMNNCGLNSGTSGNLSIRVEGGMLITPSGIPYEQLDEDKIVFMDEQAQWHGNIKPSSEWRFHYDLYMNRPEANAILHAHPVYCTALACQHREIPAFHYMVAVAGGRKIPCAPYASFGTQALSALAIDAIKGFRACLLAHHGLLCFHDDLDKVLAMAVEIEHLAKIYCQCLQTGPVDILPDDEMDRVLEKFRHYGHKAQE